MYVCDMPTAPCSYHTTGYWGALFWLSRELSLDFRSFWLAYASVFLSFKKFGIFIFFIKFTNSQNLRLFFYFVGNLLIKSSLDLYQKYRVCFMVHKISRCVPKSLKYPSRESWVTSWKFFKDEWKWRSCASNKWRCQWMQEMCCGAEILVGRIPSIFCSSLWQESTGNQPGLLCSI